MDKFLKTNSLGFPEEFLTNESHKNESGGYWMHRENFCLLGTDVTHYNDRLYLIAVQEF